eukprot:3439654-Pyramimonas_sp.AAC.1
MGATQRYALTASARRGSKATPLAQRQQRDTAISPAQHKRQGSLGNRQPQRTLTSNPQPSPAVTRRPPCRGRSTFQGSGAPATPAKWITDSGSSCCLAL